MEIAALICFPSVWVMFLEKHFLDKLSKETFKQDFQIKLTGKTSKLNFQEKLSNECLLHEMLA